MSTAVIYDTLKLAEQLEHEAGFDASRAKAMARILAGNTGGNLATREDVLVTKGVLQTEIQGFRNELRDQIQGFRNELHDQIQGLGNELHGKILGFRNELHGEIQGVRNEVQDLRVEMQDVRGDVRVLYWITGTTLAGVVGLLGIAVTVALHVMHLG